MNEQVKELQTSLLKHQEIHHKAVEKHGAEIKTVSEAVNSLKKDHLANTEKGTQEIGKINKAINALEDQLKTLLAKIKASSIYEKVEGLAEHLSDGSELNKDVDYKRLAKSILEDPYGEKYKKAFFAFIKDASDVKSHKSKFNKLTSEIVESNIDKDDSFIKKTLTTIVGDEAAYLCPPLVEMDIQKTLFETSPVRRIATVMNITRGRYEFPIRTKLPPVAWGSTEINKIDQTDNQMYQLGSIAVDELFAMPSISLHTLEDSVINLEKELRETLSEAFMLAENTAFIKGTGINRPKGIVEYAKNGAENYDIEKPLKMSQVNFKLSTYNAADGSHYLADTLLDMNAKLFSAYKRNALYAMSRQIKNRVRQVKDKNNQYLFSMGQNWGGVQGVDQIQEGLNGRINGYGVAECDDLDSAFTVGGYPIFFGNFKSYVILDRIGMTFLRDMVTTKGILKLFTRKRVGGGFKFLQGMTAMKVVA